MSSEIKRFALICLAVLSVFFQFSAYAATDDDSKLKWPKVKGAKAYRIIISYPNGKIFKSRTLYTNSYLLKVPPGKYRIRIVILNKFFQQEGSSNWISYRKKSKEELLAEKRRKEEAMRKKLEQEHKRSLEARRKKEEERKKRLEEKRRKDPEFRKKEAERKRRIEEKRLKEKKKREVLQRKKLKKLIEEKRKKEVEHKRKEAFRKRKEKLKKEERKKRIEEKRKKEIEHKRKEEKRQIEKKQLEEKKKREVLQRKKLIEEKRKKKVERKRKEEKKRIEKKLLEEKKKHKVLHRKKEAELKRIKRKEDLRKRDANLKKEQERVKRLEKQYRKKMEFGKKKVARKKLLSKGYFIPSSYLGLRSSYGIVIGQWDTLLNNSIKWGGLYMGLLLFGNRNHSLSAELDGHLIQLELPGSGDNINVLFAGANFAYCLFPEETFSLVVRLGSGLSFSRLALAGIYRSRDLYVKMGFTVRFSLSNLFLETGVNYKQVLYQDQPLKIMNLESSLGFYLGKSVRKGYKIKKREKKKVINKIEQRPALSLYLGGAFVMLLGEWKDKLEPSVFDASIGAGLRMFKLGRHSLILEVDLGWNKNLQQINGNYMQSVGLGVNLVLSLRLGSQIDILFRTGSGIRATWMQVTGPMLKTQDPYYRVGCGPRFYIGRFFIESSLSYTTIAYINNHSMQMLEIGAKLGIGF